MTQSEYIENLRRELKVNEIQQNESLITKVNLQFDTALSRGLTENEISKTLGSPKTVVKHYKIGILIAQVEQSQFEFKWGVIFRLLFMLTFLSYQSAVLLLIPTLILFATLALAWLLPMAIFAMSMAFFAVALITSLIKLSIWTTVTIGSMSLSFLGLAFILAVLIVFISHYLLLVFINIFSRKSKANLEFTNGK